MFSSLRRVVWVQKRKNFKVLRGRHNGIVDWHLGIRLGLSIIHRRRTHISYVLRALALVCFRIDCSSQKLHWYIRADSLTQKPNSSHSLAPLGYPSDPKNHQEPFLLPGEILSSPCPRPSLPLLVSLHFLISRCVSLFGNAEGSRSYRELNSRFRKNGKSLRACQSDVRGFAPIWLMMIHCSISLESRASAVP